jgi:type IV pilus assembly protein PilX
MNSFRANDRQRGVALVIALVFLLLLTILGITAMSTTSLEEKMAGNVKDRNSAFQSAEITLAAGESWVANLLDKPSFPSQSTGLYLTSSTDQPVWNIIDWASNVVIYPNNPYGSASGSLTQVRTQPKYIIEDLGEVREKSDSLNVSTDYKGKGTTNIRITARGTGFTDSAQVMLQTTYSRPF